MAGAYYLAAPGGGFGLGAFAVGQAYIVLRVIVSLQFMASQTSLFQSRLAHAGYVARAVPRWPDSPAAEAIDRASRVAPSLRPSIATIAVCAVSLNASSGRLPTPRAWRSSCWSPPPCASTPLAVEPYAWDERFHALVAAHARRPQRSTRPTILMPSSHGKQRTPGCTNRPSPCGRLPRATLFGVNELALRVPSIVWGVAAVGLTYLIGSSTFDQAPA